MEAEFVERVEVSGFEFDTSVSLGCSQLFRVRPRSLGPNDFFAGRLISHEKLPAFLKLDGAVYKVLRTHPHRNILLPIKTVERAPLSGVIFPMVHEDLHTYARAQKGLPERDVKPLFRSILSAVHHCHKFRIVLRDIRLGKIFFRDAARTDVVFGDLDGAQIVNSDSPFLSDRKGSPAFVSPEVFLSSNYDGAAADMWALGVVLYILLTGTYPFQDSHPPTLFHKLQQGHFAVYFPDTMSEAACDILRKLLVREPHLRLTAAELMQDVWLSGVPGPHGDAQDSSGSGVSTLSGAEAKSADACKRLLTADHGKAGKRARESFGDVECDIFVQEQH